MTVEQFNKIITENNVPNDAKMLSDSGWECSATDMDAIYYNETNNELVFTQGGRYEKEKYNKKTHVFEGYYEEYGWKMIYCSEDSI